MELSTREQDIPRKCGNGQSGYYLTTAVNTHLSGPQVFIASKIGCTPETLRKWVRRTALDQGQRAGMTTSDREQLLEFKRENRELKRAHEILPMASAFFAQTQLDRRPKY